MEYTEYIKLRDQAETLIKKYFEGKVDKGGHDYKGHLYRVAGGIDMEWVIYGKEISDKAYIVALLHDILEDTDCTADILREEGFDDEIIDAVVAITRRKNEHHYSDFIKRVKTNKIARIVKIYDLEDNMDIRRLSKLEDRDLKRLKKYWYSWKYLKDEIDEITYLSVINPNKLFEDMTLY